eukprot:TRINITY_DN43836_c0_g1_i1.p1 TRINITY_DN43836_c0_g1~~TRINITY_DN43836_c0_g1_i1.p1  ORF type:complete len:373 (+),score=132.14 TRINITY_DN43836_c0_g1_i1:70-1188(+)
MSGPTVLVLGGTGFIGKNLVAYIIEYNLASKVRVADKTPVQMAYMDARFEAAFNDSRVEFAQVDLVQAAGREKAFNGERWNVIINLAATTQFGKVDALYDLMGIMRLQCAQMAETLGCDKYVEVSTATVYEPRDDKGEKWNSEDGKVNPKDIIAQTHLKSEKDILSKCPNLPVVIVRLATVYGPGDTSGLMPRLTCAASYLGTDDPKMDILYSEHLRIHTLHVQDAVGGIWYIACAGHNREIYNLVDKNDTTQAKLNKIIEAILPIKTSCVGHTTTKGYLKLEKLDDVLADVNQLHLDAFLTLCQEHDIESGPLTTDLCKEQISGIPVSIDGTKVESLGYQYSVPNMTTDYVRHALNYWVDHGLFPPVLRDQ